MQGFLLRRVVVKPHVLLHEDRAKQVAACSYLIGRTNAQIINAQIIQTMEGHT